MSTKARKKSKKKQPLKPSTATRMPSIRSTQIIDLLANAKQPLTLAALTKALGLKKGQENYKLTRTLDRLCKKGKLICDRRGRYSLPQKLDMIQGSVVGHPDGFGFLATGEGDDLFLSPRQMRKVLHGDRVLATVSRVDHRGRREGRIVEVLEHHNREVVGRFIEHDGIGFVAPDDRRLIQDIVVSGQKRRKAKPGEIVVIRIIRQPTDRLPPSGHIVEILGQEMAPGMETEIAIRKHGLPVGWPADVIASADKISQRVENKSLAGRLDLRKTPLITIDGADARDFDDAVFAQKEGKGWRLLVAIADVGHYVQTGSVLDREAQERGNSVYFPDRVLPMLPERLSNGICSINPDVDRLCLVCELLITPGGGVKHYQFHEAVMRSAARLTYDEVAAILVDGDRVTRKKRKKILPQLETLYSLYQALARARGRRGTIDFEIPEPVIVHDHAGKIERIDLRERNDAHKLIEACMLVANESAAHFLAEKSDQGIFRNHDGPEPDRLEDLRKFLGVFGLRLGGGATPHAADYEKTIRSAHSRPELALVIQTMMLRSLSQAVYATEERGHFALGYDHYTHFTSPIRRYPDLVVHRLIKSILKKGKSRKFKQLPQIAEHCSMTERRADDATRDAVKWLKAEYMLDRVGEIHHGVVTAVTNFGLFVELGELHVEGLAHVTALGEDYFHFDPVQYQLTGEHTGKTFRLGQNIVVRVVRVDLDEGRIDFEPESPVSGGRKRKARRKR